MRTYYELEDYHYKEIKNAGFELGQLVYFQGPMPFDGILEGKIIKFDIHFEGSIMFRIEYEDVSEWEDSPNIWDSKGNNKNRSVNKTSTLVPMFTVKHSPNETIQVQIKICENTIKQAKSKIKYTEKKMEELKTQLK